MNNWMPEHPKDFKEDYLKRSGDSEVTGYIRKHHKEHGFMTFEIDEDCLVPICVYGNGKYWMGELERLARKLGKKKIMFATIRNYKAFERKFGFKLKCHVLEKEI